MTRLAAADAAPQTANPDFPQVTLVIDVLDPTGKPASGGLVGLINTDNSAKFVNFAVLQPRRGAGQRAVRALQRDHRRPDVRRRTGFTDRIVPVADFDVTAEHAAPDDRRGGRDRAAFGQHAPRPRGRAHQVGRVRPVRAASADRSAVSFLFDGATDVTGRADARARRSGTLHWLDRLGAGRTTRRPAPYSYDLSFLDQRRRPADQADTVQPFQLATIACAVLQRPSARVAVRTHADLSRSSSPCSACSCRWRPRSPAPSTSTATRARSGPASLIADPTTRTRSAARSTTTSGSTRRAPHFDADWLRGPLAPKPPEQTLGRHVLLCPACRSAHRAVGVAGAVRRHVARPLRRGERPDGRPSATHFSLYRGAARSLSRARTSSARGCRARATTATVPPAPGCRPVGRPHPDVDLDRHRPDLPARRPGRARRCRRGGPATTRRRRSGCTVLPVLTAQVPLPDRPVRPLPVGDSTFVLNDRAVPRRRHGRRSRRPQLLTRSAPGRSTPASLKQLGNGRYRVTLHNPASAAGQAVTLRVTAADDCRRHDHADHHRRLPRRTLS